MERRFNHFELDNGAIITYLFYMLKSFIAWERDPKPQNFALEALAEIST